MHACISSYITTEQFGVLHEPTLRNVKFEYIFFRFLRNALDFLYIFFLKLKFVLRGKFPEILFSEEEEW